MNELEQTMTRYLLGELSESEQSALEEKYFADPQVFDEVLRAESDLVDGYVGGQLSPEMHERFEQSYMAHQARSDRAKFAAALAARLDQIEQPATRGQLTQPVSWWQKLFASLLGQRPTLRLAMALATLLVVLGGVWIIESRRDHEIKLAQAEAERQRREQSPGSVDQGKRAGDPTAEQAGNGPNTQQSPTPSPNQSEVSAPRSVSLALTVGGVRGGDNTKTATLVIPPGTTQARLLLNLKENNYPSYRASLQTIAGSEIFNQTGIKPARAKSGASFVFTVSAPKLAAGDYVLTLKGINPDGEVDDLSKSLFRVEKR